MDKQYPFFMQLTHLSWMTKPEHTQPKRSRFTQTKCNSNKTLEVMLSSIKHSLSCLITSCCQHFRYWLPTSRPGIKLCEYLSVIEFHTLLHFFELLLISEAWVQVPDFTGFMQRAIGSDRCFPSCLHGCRVSLYSWRTRKQADGQPSCLMLMHTALWQAQWQADLSQAEIMPG